MRWRSCNLRRAQKVCSVAISLSGSVARHFVNCCVRFRLSSLRAARHSAAVTEFCQCANRYAFAFLCAGPGTSASLICRSLVFQRDCVSNHWTQGRAMSFGALQAFEHLFITSLTTKAGREKRHALLLLSPYFRRQYQYPFSAYD